MKNYHAILNDTEDVLAEDSATIRHDKMKRKAKENSACGDVTNCTKIAVDSKTIKYVKYNQHITARLEHYRLRYPDAKIVK